jgi:hypothetical protein
MQSVRGVVWCRRTGMAGLYCCTSWQAIARVKTGTSSIRSADGVRASCRSYGWPYSRAKATGNSALLWRHGFLLDRKAMLLRPHSVTA